MKKLIIIAILAFGCSNGCSKSIFVESDSGIVSDYEISDSGEIDIKDSGIINNDKIDIEDSGTLDNVEIPLIENVITACKNLIYKMSSCGKKFETNLSCDKEYLIERFGAATCSIKYLECLEYNTKCENNQPAISGWTNCNTCDNGQTSPWWANSRRHFI